MHSSTSDDDELFAAALSLIENSFTQRRKVMAAVTKTILLQQPSLPVFGSVATLTVELGYLEFLTLSYSVWGVESKVSGAYDDDN